MNHERLWQIFYKVTCLMIALASLGIIYQTLALYSGTITIDGMADRLIDAIVREL